MDKLYSWIPFAIDSILNFSWSREYFALQAEISTFRPSSLVKLDFNILFIWTSYIPYITFIANVNVGLSDNEIVDTHWRWIEKELFSEIVHRDVLFKGVGKY
jgi:hypothetical protein